MQCKCCQKELPQGVHGKRGYCNNAHKQAYYRQQLQQDEREKAALLAEIDQLKEQVEDQAQEIKQLEYVIVLLKRKTDLERRYLNDTQARGFIAFLRKQPSTPFIEKVLKDRRFFPTGSRWTYERQLRFALKCSEEEMAEFKNLWKVLLLALPKDDS